MVEERHQYNASPHTDKTFSANSCSFDKSANIIAVACEDNTIRIFNELEQGMDAELTDHKDIVHDVKFDFNSKMMISCGADNTVRIF